MSIAAEVARAELLAFAERLHRARGLSRLDGTPSVGVTPHGDGWRATAHLLGRRVTGDVGVSGVEDGAAGAYGHGDRPHRAVANAVEAWREEMRYQLAAADRAADDAREHAAAWRRICAEVGA